MDMMLVMAVVVMTVVVVMVVGLAVRLLLDEYRFSKAQEARHAQYLAQQEAEQVLVDITEAIKDTKAVQEHSYNAPLYTPPMINGVKIPESRLFRYLESDTYNYTDDFTVEADDTEIDTPRYVSGMRRAAVLKSSYICMDSIDDEREYSRNRRNYSKIYKINKHSRVKAAWKNYDPEYLEYSE